MKYKKFRIRNYKAIKDLTIELDNQNLMISNIVANL